MKFTISDDVRKKYEGVKFGFLVAEDISLVKDLPLVNGLREKIETEIKKKPYSDYLEQKNGKGWMDQFRKMGLNPNQTAPSQMAMIKRICNGNKIPNINILIDIANIMAVKSMLPVGVFDLDKIRGNIVLRTSLLGEKYLPMFEEVEEEIPENEIVYADDKIIFSRYSKDCEIKKITNTTKKIFFVVDGTSENTNDEIMGYINDVEKILSDLDFKIVDKGVVN